MTTEENLKKIKQSFRLLMNGVTAQSLRDKGLEYHLNWGANLLHLKEMAEPYGKDFDLAIALWKEDIRECKILATLIMPAEKFESDLATLWIEQVHSQEIAELLVMNLLQYVNYASDMAFQLLAEQATLPRLIGFNILARLFSRNMSPNERDINEFIDQAITALKDESLSIRHAALNSVQRFVTLGEMHETIARGALKPLEMDYLV